MTSGGYFLKGSQTFAAPYRQSSFLKGKVPYPSKPASQLGYLQRQQEESRQKKSFFFFLVILFEQKSSILSHKDVKHLLPSGGETTGTKTHV